MNPISFPRAPFFCADEGGYLPSLTELVIQAETMRQAAELQEQLLKLRLKQRCFIALAQLSPQSVIAGLEAARQEPRSTKASLKIFPGGSVDTVSFKPGSPPAPPFIGPNPTTGPNSTKISADRPARAFAFDPHNPYPKGRW